MSGNITHVYIDKMNKIYALPGYVQISNNRNEKYSYQTPNKMQEIPISIPNSLSTIYSIQQPSQNLISLYSNNLQSEIAIPKTKNSKRHQSDDNMMNSQVQKNVINFPVNSLINCKNIKQSLSPFSSRSTEEALSDCNAEVKKFKTELCKNWVINGTCKYGENCVFAHGTEDLRINKNSKEHKHTKCKQFFNDGFCLYGQRCQFSHKIKKKMTYTEILEKIKKKGNYNYKKFKKPRLNVFVNITKNSARELNKIKSNENSSDNINENLNNNNNYNINIHNYVDFKNIIISNNNVNNNNNFNSNYYNNYYNNYANNISINNTNFKNNFIMTTNCNKN